MGLPAKIKNFATFIDGISYVGEVEEVTLPKLKRKMEDWRGGGRNLHRVLRLEDAGRHYPQTRHGLLQRWREHERIRQRD